MNAQQKKVVSDSSIALVQIRNRLENVKVEIDGEDGPSDANQDASDTLDSAIQSIESVVDDLDLIAS